MCDSARPSPEHEGAVLGLRVTFQLDCFLLPDEVRPRVVYLSRLEDGMDVSSATERIQSDSDHEDYRYFFNLPAGRYVVVATWGESQPPQNSGGRRSTRTTSFRIEWIERTTMEVPSSILVFAGALEAELVWLNELDASQLHDRSIRNPGSVEPTLLKSWHVHPYYDPKNWKIHRSEETRQAFRDDAAERLAGSGWNSRLDVPKGNREASPAR